MQKMTTNDDPKPRRASGRFFFAILFLCILAVGGVAVDTFSSTMKNTVIVDEKGSTQTTVTATVTTTVTAAPAAVSPATTVHTTVPSTTATSLQEKTPTYVIPLDGEIVTPYRETPVFNDTLKEYRTHRAIDIVGDSGEPVVAAANGIVSAVDDDPLYGGCVIIDHGNDVTSTYCGLDVTCHVGDEVAAGDTLGTLSFVPFEAHLPTHLHLIVEQHKQPIDPTLLFPFGS